MGVKSRDLVDLGLGELHLERQRREVRCRDVVIPVLDQMQMLDEQIAAARPVTEQRLDVGQGIGIDLPPFRLETAATPSGTLGGVLADVGGSLSHWSISILE